MNKKLAIAFLKNAATIFLVSTTTFIHAQSSLKRTDGNKTVKVFTTAEKTSYRLSPQENTEFKASEPILEKNVFVFLDDTKTFQTMLGIGGAITDASAETFAKLPADPSATRG